jgi:hypothetical protein
MCLGWPIGEGFSEGKLKGEGFDTKEPIVESLTYQTGRVAADEGHES